MNKRLIALLIACVALGVVVGIMAMQLRPSADVASKEDTLAAAAAAHPAAPARIAIPVINVDASVAHVGIAASGNMAVTEDADIAAWYRLGTLPGARGSAVINGHVENQIGLPGVFARLDELQPGDELFVENDAGEVLRFVVEEVATYKTDDVPLDVLFTRSDTARLNLITCTGEWITEEKGYDSRVVVYTRLAP